jgi:hypothetical protein
MFASTQLQILTCGEAANYLLERPAVSGPHDTSGLLRHAKCDCHGAGALLTEPYTGSEGQVSTTYAERALTLAEELGMPRPARALGYRAMARCNLGDRSGLDGRTGVEIQGPKLARA